MKSYLKLTIFSIFLLFVLMIYSCEKDKIESNLSNPFNGKTTALFNSSKTYGTLTDQDGNIYKTITIGTQTWMAENLRTTKYRDGSDILEVTDNDNWDTLTTGAFCNYNNTKSQDTIATFGRLYNWYTVSDDRRLAPEGWHIPSEDELQILANYLDDDFTVGGKLKETGFLHWNEPNGKATNETGYTALPGGGRFDGEYLAIGEYGVWWSRTEIDDDEALRFSMQYFSGSLWTYDWDKETGYSIRCIMD